MAESSAQVIPTGWDQAACDHWGAGRKLDAIQAALARVGATAHREPRLALQVAYYLFLINDVESAAQLLLRQLQVTPAHFETQLNLAVCLSRLKRCEESVALTRQVLLIDPDNLVALDALASCLYRLGRLDESAEIGTRVLTLKDRDHGKPGGPAWSLPNSTPAAYAAQPGKRDVITFSLWGGEPRYLRGALRNLLLAPDLYPGWTLRFHVDATVPEALLGLIRRLGGELVMHPDGQSLREKLCWRFQVANDPGVGRFLVRDVDSVFSLREVAAVRDWQDSEDWFHVMRDWWTHTDLILAGMWGGVAGVLPDLSALMAGYRSKAVETPNIDQWFLRDRLWRHVKRSCRVHDRCFQPVGALPFPGPAPGREHVGQDEFAAHGARQESLLGAWIEAYPCLGPPRWPQPE
jgi:hypothetical protein